MERVDEEAKWLLPPDGEMEELDPAIAAIQQRARERVEIIRGRVLRTRREMKQKREHVQELREAVYFASSKLTVEINRHMDAHEVFDIGTLSHFHEAMRTAQDKLGPEEDVYDHLQRRLNDEESDLEFEEESFYRKDMRDTELASPFFDALRNLYDDLGSGADKLGTSGPLPGGVEWNLQNQEADSLEKSFVGASEDLKLLESCHELSLETEQPLEWFAPSGIELDMESKYIQRYLEKVEEAQKLKESIEKLEEEHCRILEEANFRKRYSVPLPEEKERFLLEFPDVHEEILHRLHATEDEITKLRASCPDDGADTKANGLRDALSAGGNAMNEWMLQDIIEIDIDIDMWTKYLDLESVEKALSYVSCVCPDFWRWANSQRNRMSKKGKRVIAGLQDLLLRLINARIEALTSVPPIPVEWKCFARTLVSGQRSNSKLLPTAVLSILLHADPVSAHPSSARPGNPNPHPISVFTTFWKDIYALFLTTILGPFTLSLSLFILGYILLTSLSAFSQKSTESHRLLYIFIATSTSTFLLGMDDRLSNYGLAPLCCLSIALNVMYLKAKTICLPKTGAVVALVISCGGLSCAAITGCLGRFEKGRYKDPWALGTLAFIPWSMLWTCAWNALFFRTGFSEILEAICVARINRVRRRRGRGPRPA